MVALVQIIAWGRWGDKPLFEPMMVSLLMHICITRHQWCCQRKCAQYILKPQLFLQMIKHHYMPRLSMKVSSSHLGFMAVKFIRRYVNTIHEVNPLSHSRAIPWHWHSDLKFLRALWDLTKMLENKANNLTFSITWRCHGAPTATVVFLRSAHDVPPCSYRVLVGDSLHGHGALMACSWHANSCHYALTVCTQGTRCVQCVSTASARSVYEHLRKSAPGILQKLWSCIYTKVVWCDILPNLSLMLIVSYILWRHFCVLLILTYVYHF